MFHEPEGFWPTIYTFFRGTQNSHCPVSLRALPSLASSEKVNWSSLNFTATSRKHFDRQNPPFSCKSLPKSEKNAFFWGSGWLKFTLGILILRSQRGGHAIILLWYTQGRVDSWLAAKLRREAAGHIVPTQVADKIMIFGAKLLGHHTDMALGHGWSHMELYSIL